MSEVEIEVRLQSPDVTPPKNCIVLAVALGGEVTEIAAIRNLVRLTLFSKYTRAQDVGRGVYVAGEGFLTTKEVLNGNVKDLNSLHRKLDAVYTAIQKLNSSRVQFGDQFESEGVMLRPGLIVISTNVDFEARGKVIQ